LVTLSDNPIVVAEEITQILEDDSPVADRIARAISHLKRSTGVDVCTLMRRSRKTGDLYLQATDGLDTKNLGKRVLRAHEGLAGIVSRTNKPLAVRDGPSHPDFHYIPGIREDVFHSYLGVPVHSGRQVIGVLVVQTIRPRDFSREDIALLTTVARQLGRVASAAFRKLEREPDGASESAAELVGFVRGRSLAPGCFMGPPMAFDPGMRLETLSTPATRGIEAELAAIRAARRQVRAELTRNADGIGGSEAHAVLMAHRIILEDNELTRSVVDHIRNGASAAEAIRRTAIHWLRLLEHRPKSPLAARAVDFRDIANQLLHALGIKPPQAIPPGQRVVAVARIILPGDILRLGRERLGALLLTDQGTYSHTAILARSFGIPAVQIQVDKLVEMRRAERVMVDGTEGIVLIDPDEGTAKAYFSRSERLVSIPSGGPSNLEAPATTADGVQLHIGLNAGLDNDFADIERLGPSEIGLYRTELAFMSAEKLPTVKQQVAHYRSVMERSGGRRVTFRTFDFGGDKIPGSIRFDNEENPLMGYRSTRYMLGNTELFAQQLRALLVASHFGKMSILMPMISTPEEVNLVLDEINLLKNDLAQEGVPFDPNVPIGVMLEVPSVLFMIGAISDEVDFFCVGANDLVQYLMAADRSNPRVSRLYQWHHPTVLTALNHIRAECARSGKPVTMCGEMANHPWAAMVLCGMGYDRISVDVHSVRTTKWVLSQISSEVMKDLAERALRARSSTEVIEVFYGILPDLKKASPPLGGHLETSLERLQAHALW
jgi:phosphotransferase system, enzyme I, PtsP